MEGDAKVIMKAVILAGGQGTRLRPYTNIIPKPLMPVGEFPILEIVIRQLQMAGFREIIIAVGYLSHLIESYFGDGSRWDVCIRYSKEEKPLGTAGPISLIEDLQDGFLLMNGDILTNLNYKEMMRYHKNENSMVTIATFVKTIKTELGSLECDEQGNILDYVEKPTLEYRVSTGIYVFNPKVKKYLPRNTHMDLPDLVKKLIEEKEKVAAFPLEGLWYDLGRKEDYDEINEAYADKIASVFLCDHP